MPDFDVNGLWDWNFMWTNFFNFIGIYQPFIMIIVAIGAAGILASFIVFMFTRKAK